MNAHIDRNPATFDRSRPGRALLWAVAAVALVGAPARTMAAPKLCIPEVSGVPALSGAPNWYNNVGEPQFWPRLDDPRWRGSLAKSWGTGSSEHVQFRALRDNTAVYFSWWVRVDPDLNQALDLLYVGFGPGGEDQDRLIAVSPMGIGQDLTVSVGPVVAPSTETRLRTGTGAFGPVVTPAPGWLGAPGKTRVWLDAEEKSWAINMVVPISDDPNLGLSLQSIFRMWFELQVSTSGGTTAFYRLIDELPLEEVDKPGADPSLWATMVRTSGVEETMGCEKAVSISSTDVGTYNVDTNGVARPNRIALTGSNTFFARPMNETSNQINANQICAQFRLANWGTQPNWNDVPDPLNSLWKPISPQCGLPGGLLNPGAIPAGTKAGAGNEITFNWTVTHTPGIPNDVDKCDFIGQSGIPAGGGLPAIPGDSACPNPSPTRRLHQCMLVELSGGGLTYTPASVYRNMDFVNASTFEREAEISVAGLVRVGSAADRDVYLYAKTVNMHAPGSNTNPSHVMRNLEFLERILKGDGGQRSRSGGTGGNTYGGSTDGGKPIQGRLPNEPFDVLEQVLPTYIIHAYHDTLKTVTRRGKTLKVLQPQSSFGYYIIHDGPLAGWAHSLAGAELVGPDFYRIGVPQGGSTVIKTRIEAHEKIPCSGCCCSRSSSSNTTPAKVSSLGLFMMVGAVILRRRRRR